MYTVKELAEKLEVSQTTVYNHLKKNDKELKGHIAALEEQNKALIKLLEDRQAITLIDRVKGLFKR